MLIWASRVIQSMKFGKGRWPAIVINIIAAVVAIVRLFGIVYSTKVFTILLRYLTMIEG